MPGKAKILTTEPEPTRGPVDRTAAHRQARLRAKLGAPVKAFVEPDLRRRLDQFAASRHMTMADLLREALIRFLDEQELAQKMAALPATGVSAAPAATNRRVQRSKGH